MHRDLSYINAIWDMYQADFDNRGLKAKKTLNLKSILGVFRRLSF